MTFHTAEVFLLIDDEGNFVADHDVEQLSDKYDESIGGDSSVPRRMIKDHRHGAETRGNRSVGGSPA